MTDDELERSSTALCHALGIPFEAAMLRWPPGRRETDGIWAPHWYRNVEASTGFGAPDLGRVELDQGARRLAERCRPYYERLAQFRLRPQG